MADTTTFHVAKEKNERVVTVKVPLVEPAGIEMLAGSVTRNGMLLERVTLAPPVGAGPLSMTVPVDRPPAFSAEGFSDTEDNAAGAMASEAVLFTPL